MAAVSRVASLERRSAARLSRLSFIVPRALGVCSGPTLARLGDGDKGMEFRVAKSAGI
jgi:hypothetical protein